MLTVSNPNREASKSLLVWLSYLGFVVKLKSGENPLKDTHHSEVGWQVVTDCWASYTPDEPLDWWQQEFGVKDLPQFYNENRELILNGLKASVAERGFKQDHEILALVNKVTKLGFVL